MTTEELELGLYCLNQGPAGDVAFWDENIIAFRQTVLAAISETCEMLATSRMPLASWIELERQVVRLRSYLKLADKYLRSRGLGGRTGLPVRG